MLIIIIIIIIIVIVIVDATQCNASAATLPYQQQPPSLPPHMMHCFDTQCVACQCLHAAGFCLKLCIDSIRTMHAVMPTPGLL